MLLNILCSHFHGKIKFGHLALSKVNGLAGLSPKFASKDGREDETNMDNKPFHIVTVGLR
jgi:hypothetical protein